MFDTRRICCWKMVVLPLLFALVMLIMSPLLITRQKIGIPVSDSDALTYNIEVQQTASSVPNSTATIQIISLRQLKSVVEMAAKSGNITQDRYLFIVSPEFKQSFSGFKKADQDKTLDQLTPLVAILNSRPELSQVMGESTTGKLICTLDWREHTIVQHRNYSTFKNGDTFFQFEDKKCWACDLLPNNYLIRLESLVRFYSDNKEAGNVGSGVQLWFALQNKGTSAYCPTVASIDTTKFSDPTCNSLGSQWDTCFSQFSLATGILRIVTPELHEAWLTCIWSHTSITSNASFACYNLLHEYVVDSTQLFDRLGVGYRLCSGTLLGAARDQDIIPWTPDVDMAIQINQTGEKEFAKNVFSKIPAQSNWKYSITGCQGSAYYPPLRIFPSCPVLLRSFEPNKEILGDTHVQIIKNEFGGKGTRAGTYWRSLGYVDVYYIGYMMHCQKERIWQPYENVTIRGRVYKGLNKAVDSSRCAYGKDWDKPPAKAKNFNNYKDL